MKHVLITGASSGIGLQLAEDYLSDGWSVTACGRSREKLERHLPQEQVNYCAFDTTDKAGTQAALEGVEAPDLVILNAGGCEYINDPIAFDAELFQRVMDANVQGTVNCLAALLPRLNKGSRIAVVSSSVTFLPLTRAEAYGASKAALDYLTRTLAIDLKPRGIEVTLIRPGFVDTPLTQLNDFPMPGRIGVVEASLAIREGLRKGRSEIAFPRLFIAVMRMFSWLPHSLWQRIAMAMARGAAS